MPSRRLRDGRPKTTVCCTRAASTTDFCTSSTACRCTSGWTACTASRPIPRWSNRSTCSSGTCRRNSASSRAASSKCGRRSGKSDSWLGTVQATTGSDATRQGSSVFGGPLSTSTALTFGFSGQRSERFLDPVHPDNLHNDGNAANVTAEFDWLASPSSTLSLVGGVGRSSFDVPHNEEQEEAGQDQRQRNQQTWQTASWQRAWSANTVSQVAGYHRSGSAALIGQRARHAAVHQRRSIAAARRRARQRDAPSRQARAQGGRRSRAPEPPRGLLVFRDRRGRRRRGRSQRRRARARRGQSVRLPRPGESDAARVLRSGLDSIRPRSDGRLRRPRRSRANADRIARSGARGLARRTTCRTAARSSAARSIGSSSRLRPRIFCSDRRNRRASCRRSSTRRGGGEELEPERQWATELGVNQTLARGVRLDASYWRRRVESVGDPNVLFGTTIIVPNAIARGRGRRRRRAARAAAPPRCVRLSQLHELARRAVSDR